MRDLSGAPMAEEALRVHQSMNNTRARAPASEREIYYTFGGLLRLYPILDGYLFL